MDKESICKFLKLKPMGLFIEPLEAEPRNTIKKVFSKLEELREFGMSFEQLAKLLNDCSKDGDFLFTSATVHSHFSEILKHKMDFNLRQMKEVLAAFQETCEFRSKLGTDSAKNQTENKGYFEQRRERNRARDIEAAPAPRAQSESFGLAASETTPTASVATAAAASVTTAPAAFMPDDLGDDEPLVQKKVENLVEEGGQPNLRCMPSPAGIKAYPRRPGVPEEVYVSNELMEHPAIEGLLLTRTERTFGAYLEYADQEGKIHMENVSEKNFRITWKKPAKDFPSSTEGNFVEMDLSLFPGKKT